MPIQSRPNGRSPLFLRLALGYVYLHFGLLKFFPDLSPAELIATQTVMAFSMNLLDATTAQFYLAILETVIGLGLVFNVFPRFIFGLFAFHMFGTFLPVFLLPEFAFKIAPFAPNLEGQYIFKNVVYVAAGWTVLMPEIFARKPTDNTASQQPTNNSNVNASTTRDRVAYEQVLT